MTKLAKLSVLAFFGCSKSVLLAEFFGNCKRFHMDWSVKNDIILEFSRNFSRKFWPQLHQNPLDGAQCKGFIWYQLNCSLFCVRIWFISHLTKSYYSDKGKIPLQSAPVPKVMKSKVKVSIRIDVITIALIFPHIEKHLWILPMKYLHFTVGR